MRGAKNGRQGSIRHRKHYVFEVVEVHYGDEGRVDVFVKRVYAIYDYWKDRKAKLLKQPK